MNEKDKTIQKIMSLILGMNENQLSHVLDYVENEYDEEDHEGHILEIIKTAIAGNARAEIKELLFSCPDLDEKAKSTINEIL